MKPHASLALAALAACSNLADPLVVAGNYRGVADVPPEPIGKIDLLFVVDKSYSVADDQQAIADHAQQALFDVLTQGPEGVLPDLHIAVISTDVGAGPFPHDIGCEANGDDGMFLVPTPGNFGDCQPPDGTFLVDEAGPDGTRVTNYEGTLEDMFACMIRIGTDGCGFEQPFESMQRALDGRNPGFLREDALLAVVILTDEDDCSASNPILFDPNAGELGDLASFRFPTRSAWANLCEGVPHGMAQGAAAMVDVTSRRGCLTRRPRDNDPAAAGRQLDCRAFDVSAPLTRAEQRTPIRSCAESGGREPCFEVVEDPVCEASGSGLLARVRRPSAPSGQHFVVNCLLD